MKLLFSFRSLTERSSSFFARWSWGSFKLDAPQAQSSCCLPTPSEAAAKFDLGPFVAGLQNTRLKTQGGAFNWTHIVRANMVNELRFGYAKTVPFTFQSDFGHQAAESLGIQGINVTEFTTGLPNINVTDFTGLSGGPAFLPNTFRGSLDAQRNASGTGTGKRQPRMGHLAGLQRSSRARERGLRSFF